jgi:hypothetical protein
MTVRVRRDNYLLNKELTLRVRYAKKREIDTLSKKLSIFQGVLITVKELNEITDLENH